MKKYLLFILFVLGCETNAYSAPLTEIGIIHRCFKVMAQLRPAIDNPIVAAVSNGSIGGIEACKQLLSLAEFTTNNKTRIADPEDPVSRAVIHTLHKLHVTWYLSETPGFPGNYGIQVFDPAAGYITRALFGDVNYRTVFTGKQYAYPVKAENRIQNFRNLFTSDHLYIPKEPLIGYEIAAPQIVTTKPNVATRTNGPATLNLLQHAGGGALGVDSFLIKELSQQRLDGGLRTDRRFSKVFFNNFLCRDIPVVRVEDTFKHVLAESDIPFRRQSQCVACHISIDQLAGVVRNIGRREQVTAPNRIQELIINQPSQPFLAGWPESDSKYQDRPTTGRLVFRDYRGNLVDQQISSLEELGQKLLSLDDTYICTVKRYYRYFLGVDVPFNDPGLNPPMLNAETLKHRQRIINLAKTLRNQGRLIDVVHSIISFPEFSQSDFGR